MVVVLGKVDQQRFPAEAGKALVEVGRQGLAGHCAGDPTMWDALDAATETIEEAQWRLRAAARSCRTCPLLAACARYVEAVAAPQQTLSGIIAGRYFVGPERTLQGKALAEMFNGTEPEEAARS